MPDTASGMEMEPEYIRLKKEVDEATYYYKVGADSFEGAIQDRLRLEAAQRNLDEWNKKNGR